jgi:hypothetical protein
MNAFNRKFRRGENHTRRRWGCRFVTFVTCREAALDQMKGPSLAIAAPEIMRVFTHACSGL